jgi:ABC-type transport system involved in multi-copper enzyme maturation permease subunit
MRSDQPFGTLGRIGVVVRLTLREARRRRLLWLGLALGLLFVALFALGFYYALADFTEGAGGRPALRVQAFAGGLTTAGLYVVSFLVVMVAALTAVGTISTEIDTGTIHALAAKPIRRWEIVLGKWLGHALMVTLYVCLLAAGVIGSAYAISGVRVAHVAGILAILVLESLAVLSLALAGSTMLSTLANGVVVFMLYGLAFIGGWVEQIGALLGSRTAQDLGIAASLLMPSEGLWRYASGLMQEGMAGPLQNAFGPFALASQPTPAFIVYAGVYTLALLAAAIVAFGRRDL